MIYAYDKLYLERAQTGLGRMLDFAVNEQKCDLTVFFDAFISSGLADRFGRGDFTLLAGHSGVEIAYEVFDKNRKHIPHYTIEYTVGRSPEYWLGWALAYYQWATGLSFKEIVRHVPIKNVLTLYPVYHEMDIRHFVDRMNELYCKAKTVTNLKEKRLQAGLSQSQLAGETGIPVRTIQQYEQRKKNINKAQAEYVVKLARALCCRMEELLELDPSPPFEE